MSNELPLTEGVYYILLALFKPNHGYGIIQDVQALTKDRLQLGAGTLYGALNTMMERGWIALYSEESASRKKKEYLITDVGKEIVALEIQRLKELVSHGTKILEENEDESI
ncbi:helix-turn-helix transcriptional regulator [Alkalibacter rhizosphaerae]|uniref:Helix-turn-helix transcriptional regulator n=1 Tax=Alkalibacter rhizosphaerae TaxID=2815577 RepID=A0A974XDE4_9FIRM|nr:helix-turn-helix transcriptional regulator [Alkalibacter rhizosphaerae]QSX07676.1 helix-turn-helix transcriptional regulator [Alkalibacter rhizosphaerae]